jgi:hypothetical protein
MPAPKRIPNEVIVAALLKWRTMTAAADVIGIHRKNLRDRVKRLPPSMQDQLIRAGVYRPEEGGVERNGVVRNVAVRNERFEGAHVSSGGIYPKPGEAPTLPSVQTTEPEAPSLPIKTAPQRSRPLRISDESRDALQRAAWQLQAHFDAPTNESLVLEQLIEEALPAWLTSILGAAPKK